MGKYDNLSNTKFHRWSIGEKVIKGSHTAYECICDCGTEKVVYAHMLVENNSRRSASCGCYRDELAKERFKTHGNCSNGHESPIYVCWQCMIQRTTNPNHREYKRYGGKGITVCDEWFEFENFLRDMGERPNKEYSIDRIDSRKGYYKENCKWSNVYEQGRNKNVTSLNTNGGYVGVSKRPSGRYCALIIVNKKKITIGTFDTIEEAYSKRLEAEVKYFGRHILRDQPKEFNNI